ncbi:cytochrome P450 2B6 [Parasteatoda tepidariorum]|uniref:cytochrome P450 2B6 n=1 Tax=Parasteatoda tepidariorum TaxID=114398 RepID=UPI001C718132|nr:cytochrome P450 2B6 [Parasteatoda tepidariorum]XP_015912939.2 cytochrome P450 2B6 [Parasteatoda tepidariorum]
MEFFKAVITDIFQNYSSNLVIGGTLVFLLLVSLLIFRDRGLPPGPTGIPFLGYWPFLDDENIHLQEVAWKKKYGDVFSFRVTGKLYINLASFKRLREAHITKSDCFKKRTSEYNILVRIFGDGITFSEGEKWRTVRKYFTSEFRERGLTVFNENTAGVMDEAVSCFIKELREGSNKPVDVMRLLTHKCNHIIRQTLFGLNTTVSETDINKILEDYKIVTSLFHTSSMLLHGKLAKYLIAPLHPRYKKVLEVHANVTERLQKMIDDHKRTFHSENVRDIIDAYNLERITRKSNGDPTYEYFSDETLVSNLLMFVGDGVLNVATFLTVILMALLDHPEEQETIYWELVEVCGEDRNPILADKSKLRYFNAFLLEAQRTANLFPPFPSLECTKETTIGGYRIPKGAITLTNVYAIHNDSQVYENPEKFNPSRFLATDAKPKEELPIIFGVGKRVCLGESFVLMQAFVFLAAIVKNFKLSYSIPKNYLEVTTTRTLDVWVTPRK